MVDNMLIAIRMLTSLSVDEILLPKYVDIFFQYATVARLTPDQKVACSNHVGGQMHILTGSLA